MPKTAKIDQSKLKKKASPAGVRRYKQGTFPAYDSEYRRLEKASGILGNNTGRRDMKNAFSTGGLSECKSSLLQLVGNDDKMYKEENTWYQALIPSAKDNLKTVHQDFARWQKQQVSDGLSLQPPEEWPDGLLQERLKAEARLDLRRKEKAFLKERIQKLKEAAGKLPPDRPMLPHGPLGKFQGGVPGKGKIKSVDGQKISFSPSGIPYIDHPDSPYHEMPIATYRKMSKRWKRENKIFDKDLQKRAKAYREQAREITDNFPPMFGKSSFKKMIKGETNFSNQEKLPDFEPWPSNPKWPADAKKIDEIEQTTGT